MYKINLVPEIQDKKQNLAKTNYYTTAASVALFGLLVLVLVIMAGIIGSNRAMIAGNKKAIESLNGDISEYKDLEKAVIELESGLAGAKKILDGSSDWNKIIIHLEKATPSDVTFKNLKLGSDSVEASFTGRDVTSLAKFVDSYKEYQIISMTGSAQPNEKLTINYGGDKEKTAIVKTSGSWTEGIYVDPSVDSTIKISDSTGKLLSELKYSAKSKSVETISGNTTANVTKLFVDVDVTQYRKGGDGVTFEAKFKYNGASIW